MCFLFQYKQNCSRPVLASIHANFYSFRVFYRLISVIILRFHYQNEVLSGSQESTQRFQEISRGLDLQNYYFNFISEISLKVNDW